MSPDANNKILSCVHMAIIPRGLSWEATNTVSKTRGEFGVVEGGGGGVK